MQDLNDGLYDQTSHPETGKMGYWDETGQPQRSNVSVSTNRPEGFGNERWRRKLGEDGKVEKTVNGESIPIKDGGDPMREATVVWEYVPSIDDWRPVTHYPK